VAEWSNLRSMLDAATSPVRLTWPELERIVGGLPPSASRHRAWWSGDRPHVRVWTSAGYRIANLVLGAEVTFTRNDGSGHGVYPDAAPRTGRARGGDLLLVTCVKEKRDTPCAARDLYISPLFGKQRAYAERLGVPWFILSAEHGLVAPDEWLAPYDRYLPHTPAPYRTAWGRWVAERLDLLAGPLGGQVVEIHASSEYVAAIAEHLAAKGAVLLQPLQGLTLGQRLAWYSTRQTPLIPSTSGHPHAAAAQIADLLRARSTAVPPQHILDGHGAGLTVPGVYSWWVDPAGANELSRGLGLSGPDALQAGIIYAGLAGATRWPSGKRSTNTLWSRIAGMHLGSNCQLSTLRLTLGAILSNAWGNDTIDEAALTRWMLEHLTVIAIPYEDGNTLGRLETDLLAALDPPLNLQGMSPTSLRHRISALRAGHYR
jgi:uncharacterized protein DUF6884/GIY-YIG catalytic domain-containing protein